MADESKSKKLRKKVKKAPKAKDRPKPQTPGMVTRGPEAILASLEGRELDVGEQEYKRILRTFIAQEKKEGQLELRANERKVRAFYKIDPDQRLVDPFLINLMAREAGVSQNLFDRVNGAIVELGPKYEGRIKTLPKGIDVLIAGLRSCEQREKVRTKGLKELKRRLENDASLFFDLLNKPFLDPIARKQVTKLYKAQLLSFLERFPGVNYKIHAANGEFKIEYFDFLTGVNATDKLVSFFNDVATGAFVETQEERKKVQLLSDIIKKECPNIDISNILKKAKDLVMREAMDESKDVDDIEGMKNEFPQLKADLKSLRKANARFDESRRRNITGLMKKAAKTLKLVGDSEYGTEIIRGLSDMSPSQTLELLPTMADNYHKMIVYFLEKLRGRPSGAVEIVPVEITNQNRELREENEKLRHTIRTTRQDIMDKVEKITKEKEASVDQTTLEMYKRLTEVKTIYQTYTSENEIEPIETPKVDLRSDTALNIVLQNYRDVLSETAKLVEQRIIPKEKTAKNEWSDLVVELPDELRDRNIMVARKNLKTFIDEAEKKRQKVIQKNKTLIPAILTECKPILEKLIEQIEKQEVPSKAFPELVCSRLRQAISEDCTDEDPELVYISRITALELLEKHINPLYKEMALLENLDKRQESLAKQYRCENFAKLRDDVTSLTETFVYKTARTLFKGQSLKIKNSTDAREELKKLGKRIKRLDIDSDEVERRKKKVLTDSIYAKVATYDRLKEGVRRTKKKLNAIESEVGLEDEICDLADELIKANVTSEQLTIEDRKELMNYTQSRDYLLGIVQAPDFVELDKQLGYFAELKPIIGDFDSGEQLSKAVKAEIKKIKPYLTKISKAQAKLEKEKTALNEAYNHDRKS